MNIIIGKNKYDIEFEIGDMVFLKTDNDQVQRIVCCIQITQSSVLYLLGCGAQSS